MMSALYTDIETFSLGQRVLTRFGPGIVSAINRIDSIIYVALSKAPSALYLLKPEQVRPVGGDGVCDEGV